MNLGVLFLTLTLSLQQVLAQSNDQWRDTFRDDSAAFVSHGRNPYFILEPGYRLHLKGKENAKSVDLVITVLDETMIVDGVETRVVEERESVDGTVVEISRNFFAIGKRTNNVYYFGEEVDMYKNGKLAGHEGAWQSGVSGAKFGLMIPGNPQKPARRRQSPGAGKEKQRRRRRRGPATFPTTRARKCSSAAGPPGCAPPSPPDPPGTAAAIEGLAKGRSAPAPDSATQTWEVP